MWAKSLVKLPDNVGDLEAPLACGGLTAYGAVKKLVKHQILPGRPIAVVGAAGGLGHYAVQKERRFVKESFGRLNILQNHAFCDDFEALLFFTSQFLAREQLFAVYFAVDDPTIDVTFFAGISDRHGLKVMIVFEVLVAVGVPIELIDDEVEVAVLLFGHVFYE